MVLKKRTKEIVAFFHQKILFFVGKRKVWIMPKKVKELEERIILKSYRNLQKSIVSKIKSYKGQEEKFLKLQ